MTRYKGRMSQKAIEREFPHVVEIAVPPGGLGAQLDAMHYFHRARGIEACLGLGRREEGCDYLRWYFTRPTVADTLAAEVGATLIEKRPEAERQALHWLRLFNQPWSAMRPMSRHRG